MLILRGLTPTGSTDLKVKSSFPLVKVWTGLEKAHTRFRRAGNIRPMGLEDLGNWR